MRSRGRLWETLADNLLPLVAGLSLGVILTVGFYEKRVRSPLERMLEAGQQLERAASRRFEDLRGRCADRVDPARCAAEGEEARAALRQVRRERDALGRDLSGARVQLAESSKARESWERRHSRVVAERDAEQERGRTAEAEVARLRQRLEELRPGLEVLVQDHVLNEGESWTSPDGQLTFSVIEVYPDNRARVESNALDAPVTLHAGARVVRTLGDSIYRVALSAVDYWGDRATIRVTKERISRAPEEEATVSEPRGRDPGSK